MVQQAAAGPDGADVVLRPARPDDVPAIAALLVQADLPPLFIEEFLDGFLAAERDGAVIGCGGLELYGASAAVRSVVVANEARGLGLGRRIAEALLRRAYDAGAAEAYLFTADARDFWQHLGFVDAPLDTWSEAPREGWQYTVVSQNRDLPMFAGIFPMRRALP